MSVPRSTSRLPAVTDRRTLALGTATVVVAALPVALALTDRHLAGVSTALVLSTTAGTLAVSALAVQPLLARRRRIARHQMLGCVALFGVVALGALRTGCQSAPAPGECCTPTSR